MILFSLDFYEVQCSATDLFFLMEDDYSCSQKCITVKNYEKMKICSFHCWGIFLFSWTDWDFYPVTLFERLKLLNLSFSYSGVWDSALISNVGVSPPWKLYAFPPLPYAFIIHCALVICPATLKSGISFSGVIQDFLPWTYVEVKAKSLEDQV